MDDEILLLLCCIALLIIYITLLISRKRIYRRIEKLRDELSTLRTDMKGNIEVVVNNQFQIAEMIRKPDDAKKQEEKEEKETEEIVEPIPETEKKEKAEEKIPAFEEKVEKKIEEKVEEEPEEIPKIPEFVSSDSKQEPQTATVSDKIRDWFNQIDWEKFIGENILSKIAVIVLVIGLGFFVKYAIDRDWINEIARVSLTILAGGILLFIAHRLRKRYAAFSSVLAGGGLATLYVAIAIAFQLYGLFSQPIAFVIMICITSFAVILSIVYDRPEIAVLAILGGFATPFMVSTGKGNYIVLFTYISILNIGMLVLAYFKKWNIVTVVAYFFTIILYGSWLVNEFIQMEAIPYLGAFIFATLFYLIFFLMTIINNLKIHRKFKALEIVILLSNTFLYYAAGMVILEEFNPEYKGFYTALIAVFNFIFASLLYKRIEIDRNLIFLLIGLVLTFLSLVAPIQLNGNYITVFWAVESVLLLWLSQNSGIPIIKFSSLIVLFLMAVSLVIDWQQIYFNLYGDENQTVAIVFNKAFITGLVSLGAILGNIILIKKEKEKTLFKFLPAKIYTIALKILFIITLYIVLMLELNYQLGVRLAHYAFKPIYSGAYHLAFITGLMLYSRLRHIKYLFEVSIFLAIIVILAYLSVFIPAFYETVDLYLTGENYSRIHFGFHFITVALFIAMVFVYRNQVVKALSENHIVNRLNLWFVVIILIAALSAELDQIMLFSQYEMPANIAETENLYMIFEVQRDNILSLSHRIGFPVLWGVCSFALMFIGMKYELRDMRIISLSIFFITLLKLFIVDVWEMNEAGKIIAFIGLGILLLIVSFMYQKLKEIIFEDDAEERTE